VCSPTAYDYQQEIPLTVEEVKELEKEYNRDKFAKMQFIEEWYFEVTEMILQCKFFHCVDDLNNISLIFAILIYLYLKLQF